MRSYKWRLAQVTLFVSLFHMHPPKHTPIFQGKYYLCDAITNKYFPISHYHFCEQVVICDAPPFKLSLVVLLLLLMYLVVVVLLIFGLCFIYTLASHFLLVPCRSISNANSRSMIFDLDKRTNRHKSEYFGFCTIHTAGRTFGCRRGRIALARYNEKWIRCVCSSLGVCSALDFHCTAVCAFYFLGKLVWCMQSHANSTSTHRTIAMNEIEELWLPRINNNNNWLQRSAITLWTRTIFQFG